MNEESSQDRLKMIREKLNNVNVGRVFDPEIRSLKRSDISEVYFRRRRLPHWELEGSTYFLTFRVLGPLGVVLADDGPASIVEEALWFGHCERYLLHGYVVMPDHVHSLMTPFPGWTLSVVLQGIKGFSAREINKLLGRKGPFWQDETFDHLIRNEQDWTERLNYIHDNPVLAGLTDNPEDFRFSSRVTMYGD